LPRRERSLRDATTIRCTAVYPCSTSLGDHLFFVRNASFLGDDLFFVGDDLFFVGDDLFFVGDHLFFLDRFLLDPVLLADLPFGNRVRTLTGRLLGLRTQGYQAEASCQQWTRDGDGSHCLVDSMRTGLWRRGAAGVYWMHVTLP